MKKMLPSLHSSPPFLAAAASFFFSGDAAAAAAARRFSSLASRSASSTTYLDLHSSLQNAFSPLHMHSNKTHTQKKKKHQINAMQYKLTYCSASFNLYYFS